MKIYTSHTKPGAVPVLVPEGFSLWAALFGWAWLLWHAAWIAAALLFAADIVVSRVASQWNAPALGLGLLLLQGVFGRDMLRWSLARHGYTPGPVVAARDADAALARLLSERDDLLADATEALA